MDGRTFFVQPLAVLSLRESVDMHSVFARLFAIVLLCIAISDRRETRGRHVSQVKQMQRQHRVIDRERKIVPKSIFSLCHFVSERRVFACSTPSLLSPSLTSEHDREKRVPVPASPDVSCSWCSFLPTLISVQKEKCCLQVVTVCPIKREEGEEKFFPAK